MDGDDDILEVVVARLARQVLDADQQARLPGTTPDRTWLACPGLRSAREWKMMAVESRPRRALQHQGLASVDVEPGITKDRLSGRLPNW